jgi:hypothetical protein
MPIICPTVVKKAYTKRPRRSTLSGTFSIIIGADYAMLEVVSRYSTRLNAPLDQFEIIPNNCSGE